MQWYVRNQKHFAFVSLYWKRFQLPRYILSCKKLGGSNDSNLCTCPAIPSIPRTMYLPCHTYCCCRVQPAIFFVLGGPGSGKGTQCAMIAKALGWTPICVGDLLRKEALQNTLRGNWIASIIDEGNIVPGYVTLGLLSQAIERERRKGTQAILMDGFPRTLDQAIAFEKQVGRCIAVLYLDCSLQVMKQRLLQRGLSSGRQDDVARVIQQRLETFERQTSQVVEYYRQKGLLHCFSGERAPDEIYKEICERIQQEESIFTLASCIGGRKSSSCLL
ncbi:adenylate kinase [Galdieria sulphuraria]|uniref:Adenylate kinase n=1 Tax=Galdieria sulphuraria TaxID=130081 RepID=M2XZJ6_GALSU|nr:adenylate kinase [Galdieria sulphuraria]EME29073.1 adenylate kinase [Galdieria sulphuraria]|eukprot:XP_005705593.1 adenylate kinase [Galdieria sulphuraria]